MFGDVGSTQTERAPLDTAAQPWKHAFLIETMAHLSHMPVQLLRTRTLMKLSLVHALRGWAVDKRRRLVIYDGFQLASEGPDARRIRCHTAAANSEARRGVPAVMVQGSGGIL
jgi:hypothetical protein